MLGALIWCRTPWKDEPGAAIASATPAGPSVKEILQSRISAGSLLKGCRLRSHLLIPLLCAR